MIIDVLHIGDQVFECELLYGKKTRYDFTVVYRDVTKKWRVNSAGAEDRLENGTHRKV